MKKVALIFTLTLLFSFNVYAEIYHGIDIDKVYDQSDWSSKDKIKELIDDYSLLLTYQEEFNACPKQYNKIFSCYDKITEKILRNLYVYPNNTIKTYQEFRKILLKAYSMQTCLNKYEWPSGNLCESNGQTNVLKILHFYIQDLIDSSKEKMFSYMPDLKNYK